MQFYRKRVQPLNGNDLISVNLCLLPICHTTGFEGKRFYTVGKMIRNVYIAHSLRSGVH